MASLRSTLFLSLTLPLLALLTTPTTTQATCASQKLSNNKLFANCTDLPHLNASLHYTYNPTNTSLSVAFVAPPAKSDGWVAWAINPIATGMAGAQAFIAFKVNGTLTVETYDIVSYSNLTQSKLSFDTWDLSAESNSTTGNLIIYASAKVPAGSLEKMNYIWQVGPSVTGGRPDKHNFASDNLQSKATLELAATSGPTAAPAPSTTGTPAPTPTEASAPSTSEAPVPSTKEEAPAPGAGKNAAGSSRFGVNLGMVGAAVVLGACSMTWF